MRLSNSKQMLQSLTRGAIVSGLLLSLAACGKDLTIEPDYPENQKTGVDNIGSLFSGNSLSLFSSSAGEANTPTMAVNSFLWRASLETFSFMPLTTADQLSGIIITDWYSEPSVPDERMKVNILILDKSLRADALRITAFREKRTSLGWETTPVADQTNRRLEDVVLVRARELRIANLSTQKE
jgi:hypothetical protein